MSLNVVEKFMESFILDHEDWQNISIILLVAYGFLQFCAVNLRENNLLQQKSNRLVQKQEIEI